MAIVTFPWTEDFENQGVIPDCWDQGYGIGTTDWVFVTGGYSGHPPTAHSGTYNGRLYSTTDATTLLITPPLDLSGISNPVLSFWHTQALWSPDQDELRVYYATSTNGSFNLIPGQEYTGDIPSWTEEEEIALPDPSSTYYIGFLGYATYGYGVCLDDVTVREAETCPAPTLLPATNILPTSADLGVTPGGTEDTWSYEVGLPGFTPGNDEEVTGVTATTDNPWTAAGLTPITDYEWYAQAICGFDQPKKENFWFAQETNYEIIPALSGGAPVDDPGEDGMFYFYQDWGVPWHNVWWYNGQLDMTRMKIIRMGFWVQRINQQEAANITYVVNWSTSDWGGTGFPTPQPTDTAYIDRSPMSNPVQVLPTDPLQPFGQWVELYYVIPNFNPEWVSVDLWGQNVQITHELTPPPMTSPLYSWWIQDPQPGGILLHECLPKPLGNVSTWAGPGSFTTLVACPQPTALNATNITAHSANLKWIPGLAETQWEYSYGLSPWPLPVGSGTATTSSTINPVSGLSELSTYQYYVRGNCGNDGFSLWSGPYTFVTPASCPAPTALNVSNITSTSADVSWTPGGSESSWNAEVGASGFTPGTGTQVVGIYGTPTIPWTASPLTASTQYDAYVQAYCGFDQPKKENFWIEIDENYNLIPAASGGAPVNDPGEDGMFYFYQTPENSWHNVWWYNGPVDLNRMKIIRMGFWVQRLNQQLPANITYVVNWSTPDWVTPPPPSPGFPLPPDEEFIVRSPINGPVEVFASDPGQFGQWVELYYVIPDFNPEWVSVDIWGQNVTIVNELTPPPMESPLYSWWIQDPQRGGILLHECLPKPVGNTSTWVGPVAFSTSCNPLVLPYCESFFDIWPVCWSQGFAPAVTSNRWSISATALAGGAANEMHAEYQNEIGEAWLTSPYLTVPAGGVSLSFKHFYDDFGPGLTLSLRYSNDDGLTWTTGWSLASGGGNVGPATVTVPINLSGNVIIQWYMIGNLFQFDNWYVDDICIAHTCTWTGLISTEWDNPYNWSCETVPGPFTVVVMPPPIVGSHPPVIASGVIGHCYSITVDPDVQFIIQTGGVLNVTNP